MTTNPPHSPAPVLVTEYATNWDKLPADDKEDNSASTHELVLARDFVFVSGQNMHQIAKFDYTGRLLTHYHMPASSGPHGLLVDKHDQLWVSLEFVGKIVRLDHKGRIAEAIDVQMQVVGSTQPINPAPHGICLGADGETIWFTGKRTSTIGRINPDRSVEHFALDTLAALPIFLCPAPDGGVWGTELLGGKILKASATGAMQEFNIPTPDSRPIGIIPDPLEPWMWFSEEAGRKIGRIYLDAHTQQYTIQEYTLPLLQAGDVLASLSFDQQHNLWVQVYVEMSATTPGPDYLMRIDKAIRTTTDPFLFDVPITTYPAPSRMVMMHRMKTDRWGNLWFTEMMTDKLGKVTLC